MSSAPIAGLKLRGEEKTARIPVKLIPSESIARKPSWIRVRASEPAEVKRVKQLLRDQQMHTVCEEAACPNLSQCFGGGTATFMIMGDICTRRCPFCDVAHGRPLALDIDEPRRLADSIRQLNLKYAVITSVDRDDLRDGGAMHFVRCIQEIRKQSPNTRIEILVPDFRAREQLALEALSMALPDVFNHNIETVPRLYRAMRPGSDYLHSLRLLAEFKQQHPHIATKCGLMVGLGETESEIYALLDDLAAHHIDLVTIGQYLQPSKHHAPLDRYVTPEEFMRYRDYGRRLGFKNIWSAPMVRSSYFADKQFLGIALESL